MSSWGTSRLEGYEKRLRDLAERKSHAEHETQRAYADMLFFILEKYSWIRRPIFTLKARMLVFRAMKMHKECCDLGV